MPPCVAELSVAATVVFSALDEGWQPASKAIATMLGCTLISIALRFLYKYIVIRVHGASQGGTGASQL
jgi:hypothetical protein